MSYRAFLKRFDSELRTAVQKQLADLFPHAKVHVQRVSKDRSGRVIAEVVRMATVVDNKPFQVFGAEKVIIEGQLDIADFLKQTIKVEQISLFGVQIDAWPLADGTWSIDCLKPKETNAKSTPKVILNDSLIRVRQSAARQSREIVVHGVQATVETVYAPADFGQASSSATKLVRIQGAAQSSGLLEKVNVECEIDLATKSFQAVGNFSGLQFSPKLLERLPPELAQKLMQFRGLECEASSQYFKVNLAPNQPPQFVCQGKLKSGRLQDSRLPYPIEEICSDFYCRNTLLQLRNMHAQSGSATLSFQADIQGLGLDSPMQIEAEVENLELDKRLYQSLPPTVQQQWDKFQLSGRVSGSLKLQFDGQKWQPSASIRCQQVSLKPWLFPYEFSQVEGEITYASGLLKSSRLLGRASGQVVEASLSLTHVTLPQAPVMQPDGAALQGMQWIGSLQARSLGPVAIDEDLVAALTPTGKPQSGAEKFVRSLQLIGSVELVNATFERTDPSLPRWNRTLEARIYDGRLKYEKFPFPIYNIRGTIINQGDAWLLDSFEGRNDSARILCNGAWQQVAQGLLPFNLQFVAHTVPMVDDLFRALPTGAKKVYEELQPSGSIDRVNATIQRAVVDAEIDTKVVLFEDRDSVTANGKSLRLRPRKLPFLLDDVTGKVVYDNGFVTIEHATAQNGATRLAVTGNCSAVANDKWQTDIKWLPSTRLMVDGQFVKSLPQSIQESMNKLAFYGPVNVLGTSQVVFGQDPEDITSTWDVQLAIEDGRLGGGSNISAMCGTVWIRGSSDRQNLNATGSVAMDAMRVMKTPVTKLRGPFVILENKLYFGSAVQDAIPNPNSGDRPSELTASALAGTLKLSGYGRLDTGKFDVDAKLEEAQLSALLKDIGIQSQTPEATCNANLKFRGVPWNPQTYEGDGEIRLTDAKLYELPFMMRFFSVASVNANDASAFQRATIGFRLDGDRIPLQVSADGEVLRLRGEGWTNLRREIDLQLYTYVGRRVPIGNIISPLLPESRFSTFMMVEVTGTMDSPDMQRRPFPQLEATFQQMFPEVAERQPLRDTIQRWRN